MQTATWKHTRSGLYKPAYLRVRFIQKYRIRNWRRYALTHSLYI